MRTAFVFFASAAILIGTAFAQKPPEVSMRTKWGKLLEKDTMLYLTIVTHDIGESVGDLLYRSGLDFPALAVMHDTARPMRVEYLFSLYPRTDSLMRGLHMAVDTSVLKPGYYLWEELDEQTRQAIRSQTVTEYMHASAMLVDSEEQDFAGKRNFGRPRSRPDLVRAYLDTLRIEKRLRPFAAYRNAGLDYIDYFALHGFFYRDTNFLDRPVAQLLATFDIDWKTEIWTNTMITRNKNGLATVWAFTPEDVFEEYYYALIITLTGPEPALSDGSHNEEWKPLRPGTHYHLNSLTIDRYEYGWVRNFQWDEAFEGEDDEMLRKIMRNRNRIMYEQKTEEQTDKK